MPRALYSALFLSAAFGFGSADAAAPAAQKPLSQPALRTLSSGAPAVSAPSLTTKTTTTKSTVKTTTVVRSVARPAKVAVVVAKPRLQRRHIVVHHASSSLSVPLDEVRVVAFSRPVSTVYVGNPMIADISVIDARHAFLLGKGFGHTNIVALDADGQQVVNDSVSVFGHTGSTVILHRGAAQATLTCGHARCEIAPTPGDDKDSFSSRMDQLAAHQDAGAKAANAGR